MTDRHTEAVLLTRCSAIALKVAYGAQDQREANVFQAAAMVLRSQFPGESNQLMLTSEQYFATHPDEKLASAEVVKRGWITSLPRLRDMLERQLHGR